MKVEIISTGEELLSGSVTDTNSAFIAGKFEEKGHTIIRHSTVGDDYGALVDIFKESGKRADITIVSGGLGPTIDDRSAEAAAEAAGCSLKKNNKALLSVTEYFEQFGRKMSESDLKQTILPETAECLHNPVGTAPGFSVIIGLSNFFFIPGVPWEMKDMLVKSVLPAVDLMTGFKEDRVLRKSFFLFGLSEAAVNEKLKKAAVDYPGLATGFRADFPVIEIKLSFKMNPESNTEKIEASFNAACEWVKEQVGDYVFSDSTGKIEAVVGKLLREQKKTVAVAESCTGGLIGHKLTAVAGSSDYFITSCVTYSNRAKNDILGVAPYTIKKYGAVSEETVKEMAEAVRRIADADYAIATSGIAGPGGGSPEKPVGTVFIGIADRENTSVCRFVSPFGHRRLNKIIFYMKSLDLLRRYVLDIENH